MKKRIRQGFACLTYLISVLPLGAWVLFLTLTRNSFRLEEFREGHEWACFAMALVPVLCWLILDFGRRFGAASALGLFLSCAAIGLAACGWMLILGTQWAQWKQAVAVGTMGPLQQDRLRITALGSLFLCLLPPGKLALDNLRKAGAK